ncbi:unnamed protein product [Pleuronectes platessa]|uniref:Uncharacterized protein n=1 Tax=Pleuronectes platessa TaxID=8262 RepID=A0A9N7U324_PLEPL|nr:unnamed protein product [Pleuronectes platessa]
MQENLTETKQQNVSLTETERLLISKLKVSEKELDKKQEDTRIPGTRMLRLNKHVESCARVIHDPKKVKISEMHHESSRVELRRLQHELMEAEEHVVRLRVHFIKILNEKNVDKELKNKTKRPPGTKSSLHLPSAEAADRPEKQRPSPCSEDKGTSKSPQCF